MERLGKAWKGLERLGKTWRHGGLEQREVWAGKWVLWGWKIGLWASKMALGTSKLEAKWVPGSQNRGLECPGTSKIGSWTVWKAVWRARGSSGRPSWGPRAGLDAILGSLGRPGTRFGIDFGGFGGPKRIRKAIFWIQSGKVQNSKSFVFQCVFNDFGASGALKIDQNAVKWLSKSILELRNRSWRLRNQSWGSSLAPKSFQKGYEGV